MGFLGVFPVSNKGHFCALFGWCIRVPICPLLRVFYPQNLFCDPKFLNLLTVHNSQHYFSVLQETVGIINLLDPEGKGKINFQEFCRGVQEVLEVQGN